VTKEAYRKLHYRSALFAGKFAHSAELLSVIRVHGIISLHRGVRCRNKTMNQIKYNFYNPIGQQLETLLARPDHRSCLINLHLAFENHSGFDYRARRYVTISSLILCGYTLFWTIQNWISTARR